MGKKLTNEYVKSYLEKFGYIQCEDYQGYSIPMKCVCPKGHLIYIKYGHFKYGHRCAKCYGNNVKSIDEVKEKFLKHGYVVLNETYTNNSQKLCCVCSKGHRVFITCGDFFNSGVRCSECFGNKKLTLKKIKEAFYSEGYVLISDFYVNNHTKLKVRCPKNHLWGVSWNSFQGGSKCPYCSGRKKKTIKEIRERFKEEGLILCDTNYSNNTTKLEVVCSKGHRTKISWNSFQQGGRCKKCSSESRGNKLRYTIEFIRKEFEKEGYTLLSDTYKNSRSKLKFKCPRGHIKSIRWNNFQTGQRCSSCSHITSRAEESITNYLIKKVGEDKIIRNDRSLIGPLELDIYIPEKEIAVEYCGSRWHSEFYGKKDRKYHRKKAELCKEIGIRLITIYEHDFIENSGKYLNMLNSVISDPSVLLFESLDNGKVLVNMNWGLSIKVPSSWTLIKERKYKVTYLHLDKKISLENLKKLVNNIPNTNKDWLKLSKRRIDRLWDCGYKIYSLNNKDINKPYDKKQ